MNDRRGRRPAPITAPVAARGFAAALVVGALVASLLAACGTATPTAAPSAVPTLAPTAGATSPASAPAVTAAPTAVDTGPVGAPACAIADLKASHGIVEGAAGSLMTEVVLVSADTCSVDAFPALGLRDAAGTRLVGAPSTGPGVLDLVPGLAYRSQIRLANWCAPEPDFPVTLVVIVGGADLTVTGDPFPEEGDLPPCNGEVGPILEGTGWEATP